MAVKCKICGSELERTRGANVKPGVRYDCPTRSCPVIFAKRRLNGEIEWMLEARPRERVIEI